MLIVPHKLMLASLADIIVAYNIILNVKKKANLDHYIKYHIFL